MCCVDLGSRMSRFDHSLVLTLAFQGLLRQACEDIDHLNQNREATSL